MTSNNLFEFDKIEKQTFGIKANEIASMDNLNQSTKLLSRNDSILIGTDEAGRGPGAGGVFASAVYFPNPNTELIEKLSSLNDSKKLTPKKREELYDIILENTINSTICIEVEEIEKINILNASLKAMKLACENVINQINTSAVMLNSFEESNNSRVGLLSHQQKSNVLVLVDGNKKIKDFTHSQKFIIKGDSKSASIAAASILAKVSRDRYMSELDKKFPQYNWKKNAGYLTKEHLTAIDKFGISPIHRKSFLRKHFERAEQLTLY